MPKNTADDILINLNLLFYSLIEDCDFVTRALYMGVLTLGEIVSPQLSDVRHFHASERAEFGKFFGFLQDEVDVLLGRFGRPEAREDVRLWYDGYAVKPLPEIEVYNPVSIVSFLRKGDFGRHWVNQTADFELFKRFFSQPEIGSAIQRIISGNSHDYRFQDDVSNWNSIAKIRNAASGENLSEKVYKNAVIKFIAETGYLTRNRNKPADTNFLEPPNLEIKGYLRETLFNSEYLEKLLKLGANEVAEFRRAVVNLTAKKESVQDLAKAIHLHFIHACPVRDETDLHGIMYGSLIGGKISQEVKGVKLVYTEAAIGQPPVNRPGQPTRSRMTDLTVITDGDVGIVLDHKLNSNSLNALTQIYKDLRHKVFKQWFPTYELKHTVFLGVRIDEKCTVSISYKFDSTDPDDVMTAETVQYPEPK